MVAIMTDYRFRLVRGFVVVVAMSMPALAMLMVNWLIQSVNNTVC